jgi:hypothetical protein
VFLTGSRYAAVPTAVYVDSSEREIPYVLLRLSPSPPPSLETHLVGEGDRLDRLANAYLGDPEQYWRICDANLCVLPEELEEPGRRLAIPLGVR